MSSLLVLTLLYILSKSIYVYTGSKITYIKFVKTEIEFVFAVASSVTFDPKLTTP